MRPSTPYSVGQPTSNPDGLRFQFVSENPVTGRQIQKIVEYGYMSHLGEHPLYNLGFGDIDPVTYEISDLVISQNDDMRRVFATVLSTIDIFFKHYPDAYVYITGSDLRRMRLYVSFASTHYTEISARYTLYGSLARTGAPFHSFRTGNDYQALLLCMR